MFGLVKNGVKMEVITDMPAAIGPILLNPVTSGEKVIGIIARTTAISGFAVAGRAKKRTEDKLKVT